MFSSTYRRNGTMAKRTTTYQYNEGDDPLTVANQFGITPQQLLAANPGGTPFSVGQQIAVPQYQYSAPTPMAANVMQHQQAIQQANTATGPLGVSDSISGLPQRTPNPAGTFDAAIQSMI